MDRTLALGVLLSLQDRISPALSTVLGRVRNVSQSTSRYQQQLRALENQASSTRGLQRLNQQLGQSGRNMDQARQRVAALGRQMADTSAPTATLTRQFEAARRTLNNLQNSHASLTARARTARQALREQGVDTRHLSTEHERLQRDIAQTTRQLERYNAAMRRSERIRATGASIARAGAVATGVGLAGRAALTPAVSAFAEQEDAATQLKVSMMGAGGAVSSNFEKINALAENLGNRLPGTTSELQTMMSTLIQQGASEQAILGGLGVASANLGVVLKKPYKDAAEFAAKLQDATGATEDQMMGLMDVIQRTFYLGTDADNMLAGITKLSPAMDILKRKGLDAANTFAPLLIMADQAGMQGEAAGNAYRKIFTAAMNADDKVTKVNKALRADGHKIKLDFTDGKGEFGGMDKLFAQLDKLKGLDTQSRLGAIKGIFGDDAETLQAVALLIENGTSGYAEVQKKMAAQADIQARVNAQLGTLSNLWEAVTGTFTNLKAGFIAPIADDLKAVTEWLAGVQEQLSGWMKQHPNTVRWLARIAFGLTALATVLGVVLVAAGGVAVTIGVLWLKMQSLSFVFGLIKMGAAALWPMLVSGMTKVTVALRAMAMAAMSNPIILVVMALAAAAYLIWRNWDWLQQKFSQFWSWLSQSANGVIASFRDIGGRMVDGIINGFSAKWAQAKAMIASLAAQLPESVRSVLGIHSPSRVFAQIGGHITDGLTLGFQGGAAGTLSEIQRISQLIAQSDIVMPGGAQGSGPVIGSGLQSGGRMSSQTVVINVYATPGMDEKLLAQEVQRQLSLAQRKSKSDARSNLYDEH